MKKRGRPLAVPSEGRLDSQVTVRVSDTTYDRLELIAAAKGLDIPHLTRELYRRLIDISNAKIAALNGRAHTVSLADRN